MARRKPDGVQRPAVSKRHPLLGGLKGMIEVAPGVDLTQPACPEWAAMLDAMGLPEFRCTLSGSAPPAGCAPALAALWWAAKGDWNQAHRLVMELSGKDAAWVHAYLHRVEGDLANARYWYREAGRPVAKASLDQEWTTIAEELLQGVSD